MIEAVIFDMDGVIIDSEPAHEIIENEMFESLGIKMSQEEHDTFTGTTTHSMWSTIKSKYNLSQSVEVLVEMKRNKYLDHFMKDKSLKPIDGVEELIKNIYSKKIKLALASSSPINIINAVLERLDLKKYFDVIVSGDFLSRSKPEPDIFIYTAGRLNCMPSKCTVIEDSSNGVKAAKKAGMKCIGFRNPNSGNQDLSLADKVIHSFGEIRVNELNNI